MTFIFVDIYISIYNLCEFVFIFYFLFMILFFRSQILYASAWPRDKGQIYASFESLYMTDKYNLILQEQNPDSFYQTLSYKFYLEYGLTDKFTIGGYTKNFHYRSRFENENIIIKKNYENNFFSNLFFMYNLYNVNENLFSIKFGYYFPLKYNDFIKKVDNLETKNISEISLLFGKNGYFENVYLGYYLNAELSYRDSNQILFELTNGFRTNPVSTFAIQYKLQYNSKNLHLIDYSDNTYNQFKVMLNTQFLDDLSVEFAVYKIFYKELNSTGLSLSFVFVSF